MFTCCIWFVTYIYPQLILLLVFKEACVSNLANLVTD